MTRTDWNETASGVADYVQQFRMFVERGAVPLQLERPSVFQDECPLMAVFGIDHALGDPASREVELVRKRVQEAALEEFGFGISPDGSTWALLVRGNAHFQTNAGKLFQKELLKIFLEDTVWRAWNAATA